MGSFRTTRSTALIAARHRRDDEGVSLIEVMVAFSILLITVLPLTWLLTTAVSSAANSRQRQAALQLADSWLEVLSNSSLPTHNGAIVTNSPQDPSTFVSATTTQIPKSTLAGTNFTVTANFTTQSVNNLGQSDLCSSGQPPSSSHPAVILLQVTVSWDHGIHSVTDTTAVNYPQPGLQTEGFLAVQVSNAGGFDVMGNMASDRLQAVPVNIQDALGNTLTLHPDQNGCVFAQVPVGTYTVSLGQPVAGTPTHFVGYPGTPPFVSTANSTTDSATGQPVTVTAETVVQLSAFDEGITTSIAYGASSAVDDGVACPGTTNLTCVATGNGTTGASAAWGGAGSAWSSTTFAGVTNLAQVACTAGGSPTCVAVGSASGSGVIRTTSSDLGTTSPDTAPAGVTAITQVTCPSAHGCYALGTTATGPVLLAGAVGQSPVQNDKWSVVAPASTTFTGLSSIACPTSSTCELTGSAAVGASPSAPVVLRLDGDPATLATNPAWTPTFTTDTIPAAAKLLGKVTCPTSTLCEAIGYGDSTSAIDPTVLTATIGASGASTWTSETTFPTGALSVIDISCTSSTCVAIGTKSGAPSTAVWTGDLTSAPHDWSAASGIPASVSAVSSVACGNPSTGDAADCVLTANASSASVPGVLLQGALSTAGGWAWNPVTLPSGTSPRYFFGAACESSPSSSRSACAAVGATATGPIIVTAASGPGGAWTVRTPSSLPGALVTGIPLETAPAPTTNFTTQVAAGQASNATSLAPTVLYPQASGYSLAAGDCLAEGLVNPGIASLSASPGGTASATIPLGLLPLQVVTPAGVPVSGATVKITSALPSCPSDTYTLPVTDAYGITRTSVPYGTYSYTVTTTGAPTTPSPAVTLTLNASLVSKATTGNPVPATTYLPGPVVVSSS